MRNFFFNTFSGKPGLFFSTVSVWILLVQLQVIMSIRWRCERDRKKNETTTARHTLQTNQMALISEFLCFCEPNLTQLQTIWWCFSFYRSTPFCLALSLATLVETPSCLFVQYTTNDFPFFRTCTHTDTYAVHSCHSVKRFARKWDERRKKNL